MKKRKFIRVGEHHLLIENIISEGGYGFIYQAAEISPEDFKRLVLSSGSKGKDGVGKTTKKKGFMGKFLKKLGRKKVKAPKVEKKEGEQFANVKKGQRYALKKMITQNPERLSIFGFVGG